MLASYNWLKEYCESKLDPDTMAAKFTAAGLEVTSVTPVNQPVAELYIGIIDKIEKHPNADKLSLVSVTTGRKQYSVVCGAPNIQEKQKILLAAPGAVLPGNFKIKKTKIRGVASSGMICSREELGLEEKSSGIWVLPEKAQLSDSPAQYIGQPDYIFDIDLTSNRGDCLSIIGIARELSAITGNYLSYKEPKKYPNRTGNINIKVTAPEKCPRYTARLVRNVRISASPEWLRRRLYLHNIRPINNVVDITNLVLLEYGQPLHAFDYNKINGKKINVRTADKGESIKTLDEQEHTLDNEDLVICDARRPIALAGIMGGENTGIDNNTSDILIESAWFDPLTIRKTSKKHKISSDSSIRFEKGVDISKVTDALNYCAGLIRQLAGGEIVSSVKDIYPQKHTRREIILKYSKINRYLGCSLDKNEIINILTRLDFKIKHNDKEQVQLLAPLSRHDVVYEWDVIEEIGRIYGYNKLPEKLPYISNSTMQIEAQAENSFQEAAAGLGYNQCINFSF
ncbi:MAG TPA: phenylalanine--tRNA ligase subunit beta, partial [Spirochaetota bacterium]|nr:phenylalanine--tRNA ligase subunit beta [Spirochaetota bacterium]